MSVLTEITYTNKEQTRKIIDEVVLNAYESVCSTMGPNGNYVIINQTNMPKVTKDGVSVAKALDFNEARMNLVAKIITEPAVKTDNEVGDGTTTTVFQMYQLYNAFKDHMSFKEIRYLDSLMREVKTALTKLIIPGDLGAASFRSMLMTSSNYEETIVDTIMDIYKNFDNPNINLQITPALTKDDLVASHDIYFETQMGNDILAPKEVAGWDLKVGNCNFIIIDGSVPIVPEDVISTITTHGFNVSTFLVARNFENTAINSIMSINQHLQRPAIMPVKLPVSGSLGTAVMNDLATLLNTRPLFSVRDVKSNAEIVTLDIPINLRSNGIYIPKENELVKARADEILAGLDERYNGMTVVERANVIARELAKRISRLRANNVTIRVTGVTSSDAKERHDRYEDVMKAAKTGLQYGVIPGIGYGYMQASAHVAGLPAQSDVELESLRLKLVELLTYQYSYLTGIEKDDADFGNYIDLVTGGVSDVPTNVFDNAAATMIAIEGAWATAKTLSKTNNVMGRSNQSYK